jgi:hypothetical protein
LLVVNVATPDELTLAVPIKVEPSKKLTVPSGEPEGTGETLAVRRMGCPAIAGLGPALRVVVVDVGLATVTTSVTGLEVDPAKPELPEYRAVME